MKSMKTGLSVLTLLLGCAWSAQLFAQSDATPHQRLDHDIKYLASDEMEGREPGTKGIELAATYMIDTWKQYGVAPGGDNGTYRQDFEVNMGTIADRETTTLAFSGNGLDMKAVMGDHFQPMMVGGNGSLEDAELVFVGYGITATDDNYNDFAGVDCNGKIVVAIRMEPQQKDPKSVFAGTEPSRHASITRKLQLAMEAGAAGFILVNDGVRAENSDELAQPSQFGRPEENIPFFHMKRDAFDSILDKAAVNAPTGEALKSLADIEARIDATLEPISQVIGGVTVDAVTNFTRESVTTSNVIGVIEGEGPNADEVIIIGGHYDHLGYGGYGSNAPGRREIHNGADDNATGTAGLVELARRFAMDDKKPARKLVFIAFSGEERGLLGSAYYVENPIYKLEDIVTMINYDMIGRLREDKLTIFGSGTGTTFDKIFGRC